MRRTDNKGVSQVDVSKIKKEKTIPQSKIFGDPETIKKVRESKPGDPQVYVNMEAVNELPEQFEIHFEKVKFDPRVDFVNVGNETYMPTPQLMNVIAEARGIEGTNEIQMAPIIEEVDIGPLLCNPLGSEPILRKTVLGKRVVKTGRVLTEDGTYRVSDPCAQDFNVWERCLIEWSKEEELTNGYDPALQQKSQKGDTFYNWTFYDRATKGQKTVAYYPKYNTKYKRKRHFDEAMKFAQRNADTKARNIVIRVLAGLKTGYKPEDLKAGYFIFSKIRKSREILKLETAADLAARSQGRTSPADQASLALFGAEKQSITLVEDEQPPIVTETLPPQEIIPPEPEPDNRGHMLAVLKGYRHDNFIIPEKVEAVDSLIGWLEGTPDAEKQTVYWDKAISVLKAVDASIPEGMRTTHDLY